MSDAMAVLPKLSTGLDVNVRFTGVSDFEYTPECIVFDLLDIPLYHGWLVDPQVSDIVEHVKVKALHSQLMPQIPCFGDQIQNIFFLQSPEMVAAVGKLSYNQLVEKIIGYKHSDDSSRVSEGRGPSESLLDIHLSCHQPLSW